MDDQRGNPNRLWLAPIDYSMDRITRSANRARELEAIYQEVLDQIAPKLDALVQKGLVRRYWISARPGGGFGFEIPVAVEKKALDALRALGPFKKFYDFDQFKRTGLGG